MNARPIVSRLLQHSVRRYHGEKHFKPPTMDDLPVPKGSWQEHYDKNQKGFNMVLALGVGWLAVTIAVAKTSGLVYFNFSPPKSID